MVASWCMGQESSDNTMRLQTFINESEYDSFLDITQLLYKEAKPFMLQLGKEIKGYMLSGRKSETRLEANDYFIKHIRQNRKPKDTLPKIHKELDRRFSEKFGWKARSTSIFVTGNYNDARSYGKVYIIIPVGYYNFVWSDEIDDLLTYMRSNYIRAKDVVHAEDYDELMETYTDTNLTKAINSNHEIMLGAKKVIGIDYNHYSNYLDRFLQYGGFKKRPTVRIMEDFIEKMNLKDLRDDIL